MNENDVIVVGAGPTGLMLAGDLAAYGLRTTLVERRAEESNLTRAFAVHARTLELLDIRGVADDLASTGARLQRLNVGNGINIDLSPLPTRFPYLLITPQYETERVLEKRARENGVEFLDGTELVGLRQDADGVDVDLRHHDGTTDTRRAAYVVGADGVRSAVRKAVDLPFPGVTAITSVILADVRLAEPPPDVITVSASQDGFAFTVPFGDGFYRVIAWDRARDLPDDAPVTLDELRDITRRVHGTDWGMHDARWLSRFHSDERQVPHYRVGRVFLAGDAAHVHTPAGGQGMNAGLQDVANLSWRLAQAVHGHASERLLDGYDAERHPIGRAILRGSGALIRFVTSERLWARAARLAVGLARNLDVTPKTPPLLVSGIGVRYRREPGSHHLVGTRVADIAVSTDDGTKRRLYEVLRDGRFALVTAPGTHLAVPRDWTGHVTQVRAAGPTDTTVLVRPDSYVAWASNTPTQSALREALTEWCPQRKRRDLLATRI